MPLLRPYRSTTNAFITVPCQFLVASSCFAGSSTNVELQIGPNHVRARIPKGATDGQQLKLRGKGVPHLNEHGKGDLIVEIRVSTPGKLTKTQRELLKQLGETMTVENTPTSRGLFSKVKDIFS